MTISEVMSANIHANVAPAPTSAIDRSLISGLGVANALVVTFGTSNKPADIVLSIALYPRYVTLFVARGAELPDPQTTLEGSGSAIRGVRLQPVSRIETGEVGALIDAAISIAAPSMPPKGSGPLIVKSISAKQRPRRPQV